MFSDSVVFATKKLRTNLSDAEERRIASGCRRSCRGRLGLNEAKEHVAKDSTHALRGPT